MNSGAAVENPYERPRLVAEYLLFHYGAAGERMPWEFGPDAGCFPERCARLVWEAARAGKGRALDVGCAVGRSTFEMARGFAKVTGIDFSAAFIGVCETLRRDGRVEYRIAEEGLLDAPAEARVPPGIEVARVGFEVGDACALRRDLGAFDAVLAANVIDRLPHPAAFLARLPELVRHGGVAVITSPYTWMEEFTPAARWIGGRENGGRAVRTLEGLDAALSGAFRREARLDVPFLIREHRRKFQWSVAEATVWRRAD